MQLVAESDWYQVKMSELKWVSSVKHEIENVPQNRVLNVPVLNHIYNKIKCYNLWQYPASKFGHIIVKASFEVYFIKLDILPVMSGLCLKFLVLKILFYFTVLFNKGLVLEKKLSSIWSINIFIGISGINLYNFYNSNAY